MASTNSWGQTDLGPRRVGVHFRKLACRSDAVDEVLGFRGGQDFGARPLSTGPPREGEPGRLGRIGACSPRLWLRGVGCYRVADAEPRDLARTSGTNTGGSVLAWRPNKAMKLTRGGWCGSDVGARLSSRRTAVIVRGLGRSRPSQLIWGDRCQVRGCLFVDVGPPWGSETTVEAGRFDDESI
jgi:hypothetical protein